MSVMNSGISLFFHSNNFLFSINSVKTACADKLSTIPIVYEAKFRNSKLAPAANSA